MKVDTFQEIETLQVVADLFVESIYGLFSDKRVAVFAFIGMMIAIVLLLVVQRAIRAVSARDATLDGSISKNPAIPFFRVVVAKRGCDPI